MTGLSCLAGLGAAYASGGIAVPVVIASCATFVGACQHAPYRPSAPARTAVRTVSPVQTISFGGPTRTTARTRHTVRLQA